MKTHTHILCWGLIGLCQFANAQSHLESIEEPYFDRPIVSVSKVFETDASGKKDSWNFKSMRDSVRGFGKGSHSMTPPSTERDRLRDKYDGAFSPWQLWGPYVSERSWASVREDYSADGNAWDYFPHDHARSRAYRWGEIGRAHV